MNTRPSPIAAACVALALLALGFAVGYGFHTSQSVAQNASPETVRNNVTFPQSSTRTPPVMKGLRVSPDGNRVAFAAVWGNSEKASRVVLDLRTGKYQARESPRGWQDFVVQWSRDGKSILFDREKIPDDVADTQAGLHSENIAQKSVPVALAPGKTLPSGEKSVAGFWMPNGQLIVKTRREPKSLFAVKNGKAQLLDRANVTYFQNRAARENGRDVIYAVRDVPEKKGQNALFRIENGRATQISDNLGKMSWAYVAENARFLVVCRPTDDSWNWSLYRVTPTRATLSSTRTVPSDVISVFWSPSGKQILGAGGDKLWTIQIPSLKSKQIGARSDWNADDAVWLRGENAILVASRGVLWKVNLRNGSAKSVWKFPDSFWK